MPVEIVLKFKLSGSKSKQKVNITSLRHFSISKLNEVQSILNTLNDLDVVRVNYPDHSHFDQLKIKSQIQEYLAFIRKHLNWHLSKPLNGLRSLGWKY